MQVASRLRLLLIVFAVAFAAVEARLVHLQFRTREFWQKEAIEARTDVRTVSARRGDILDRWGRPLAVSRPEHELSLAYAPFRQNTPIGQIHAASRILALLPAYVDRAPTVANILAAPIEWARLVLERSDAELAELPPQLRRDYGYYVRRLLGLTESQYTKAKADHGAPNLPFFTITGDDRTVVVEGIAAAVRAQQHAIEELALAAKDEQAEAEPADKKPADLLTRIDEEIAELESEVKRALDLGKIQPGSKQEVLIRRDLEYRAREVLRDVAYAAVYLVNLSPEVYAGFEVHDEERRFYPEDTQDLCPILIGRVTAPPDFRVKLTEEKRSRLLQLQSLPPELMDQEDALEIERLRKMIRETDYLPEEEMGAFGLEGLLEPQLRGRRGWRSVETDSAGQDQKYLSGPSAVPGADVRMTLDIRLQQACDRVLKKKGWPGAIVLLDPKDGAIRAMGTWPFPTRKQWREDYEKLAKDPRGPLFHRGFQAQGNPPAPGSVFKIVVAAAALESGKLSAGTQFDCQHSIMQGNTPLRCESRWGHGSLDLETAFLKSCNIYFYNVGKTLTLKPMIEMAERLGIGHASGFGDPKFLELDESSRGLGEIPCTIKPSKHDLTSVVNAMRSAIGQATFDDVTPLQIATIIAPFANGGNVVRPYIIETLGEYPAPHDPPKPSGLARSTVDTIRHAMKLVCEEGGTAGPRKDETVDRDLRPYRVAGKTGTAQVAKPGSSTQLLEPHAWFAGMVPYDDPKLVFAVYLENIGEHGGDAAAPLLNRLLEQPELLEALDMQPAVDPAAPPKKVDPVPPAKTPAAKTQKPKDAKKDTKPKGGAARDPRKGR